MLNNHVKVKVKSFSRVPDSLPPVDYSPPSSSVHGLLQERILEWVPVMICFKGSLHTSWAMGPTYNQYTPGFGSYIIEFTA